MAERVGLPLCTFDLTFPIDFHVMTTTGDIPDASELEALRQHVGLPPADDPDWFLGDLVISTLPNSYRGDRPLREPAMVVRPNVVELVDDAPTPGWVDDLDGAVYVSFGTVFPQMFPEVVATAALGASASGRHTILTHGPSVDGGALQLPHTPNLRVERYVPQGPVLDRCGASGRASSSTERNSPLTPSPRRCGRCSTTCPTGRRRPRSRTNWRRYPRQHTRSTRWSD